jgi:hypothetical protein
MKHNRFAKGSGCFRCSDCGKLTRETGVAAKGSGMCDTCWEIAGWYNAMQDGEITEEEYNQKVAEIKKEDSHGR